MQIRNANLADLDQLIDLDGAIESPDYLHLDRREEDGQFTFQISTRPLREKRLDNNPISPDQLFSIKQIMQGVEEGIAFAAEHDGQLIGLAIAQLDLTRNLLRLIELRIDFDFRRQGIGSAMLFQIIAHARGINARAVAANIPTDNHPASAFLLKSNFELTGFDTHFNTNHDLVKESVLLFWYLPLN